MGGKYSQVQYNADEISLFPQFLVLAKTLTAPRILQLREDLVRKRYSHIKITNHQQWLKISEEHHLYYHLTDYLFECLKTTPSSKKVYVLELVAALAFCSTLILSLDEKLRLLYSIFNFEQKCDSTESDIKMMIITTLNGLCKFTIGLHKIIQTSSSTSILEELSSSCFKCCNTRDNNGYNGKISEEKFVKWATCNSKITYLMRHFSAIDSLNPFSFNPLLCESSGVCYPYQHRKRIQDQKNKYATFRKELLTTQNDKFEQELKQLQSSAASIKIQSKWRGHHLINTELKDTKDFQNCLQNAAAKVIQSCVKNRAFTNVVLKRAHIERCAFNGAVLMSGTGFDEVQASPLPLNFYKFNQIKSKILSCSATFHLTVDEEENLFLHGKCLPAESNSQQSLFDILHWPEVSYLTAKLPVKLKGISCGRSHVVILCENGSVFSWGFNDHGQVGHGDNDILYARSNVKYESYFDFRLGREDYFLKTPVELAYFKGCPEQSVSPIKIVDICSGDYYSLALSSEGEVYSWGEGSEGQLGLGILEDFEVGYVDVNVPRSAFTYTSTPRRINKLSHKGVRSIKCEGNHNVALCDNFKLFQWGAWGRRIGSEIDPTFDPIEVENIQHLRLQNIELGKDHYLADGCSLWIELVDKISRSFYLTMAEVSSNIEQLSQTFSGKVIDLVILNQIFDNIDQEDQQTPSSDENTILWHKRVRNCHCSVEEALKTVNVSQTILKLLNEKCKHEDILQVYFKNIRDKLVLLPYGRPSGCYISLYGLGTNYVVKLTEGSTCSKISKIGIFSGLIIVPKDQTVNKLIRSNIISGNIAVIYFTSSDLNPKKRSDDIAQFLVQSIAIKIRDFQGLGAICVIIILDFEDIEPFQLRLEDSDRIFIPVGMIDKKTGDHILEFLDYCPEIQLAKARVFNCANKLSETVSLAFKYGALGVIIQQGKENRGDGTISPPFVITKMDLSDGDNKTTDKVIGMVSDMDGEMLSQFSYLNDENEMIVKVRLKLSKTGNIYAWGCAEYGQLGLGHPQSSTIFEDGYEASTDHSYRFMRLPYLIRELSGKYCVKLVCGSEHSVAVTENGNVYTWGSGKNGKLGHGDTKDQFTPKLIKSISKYRVVEAACSEMYTTLLTQAMPDDIFEKYRKEINLLKAIQRDLK